jgi:hypothetical protein
LLPFLRQQPFQPNPTLLIQLIYIGKRIQQNDTKSILLIQLVISNFSHQSYFDPFILNQLKIISPPAIAARTFCRIYTKISQKRAI